MTTVYNYYYQYTQCLTMWYIKSVHVQLHHSTDKVPFLSSDGDVSFSRKCELLGFLVISFPVFASVVRSTDKGITKLNT